MSMMAGLGDALPVLLLIALGVALRLARVIPREGAPILTRLAYYVTIPAAIYRSIARAPFEPRLLYLPLIGLALPALLSGIAYLATRRLAAQPGRRGVIVAGMTILGVFGYAFMEAFYGQEGLTRIALFDVGNALYAGTLSLWLAGRLSPDYSAHKGFTGWKRVATSPVMWAALLGLAASILEFDARGVLGDFLDRLVRANTPLAMIAVGVFIRPRRGYGRLIAHYLLLRTVLGGLLGWLMALALGLGGLDLIAVCVGATLPAGTTTLIYAAQEGLDAEFCATMISVSVIVSTVLINILPHLLAMIYF
ncbi:MAG: AEC family transporter [Anaerolineae bacterium]|nr:AEC family transporter [Anaerolineae bacterium]